MKLAILLALMPEKYVSGDTGNAAKVGHAAVPHLHSGRASAVSQPQINLELHSSSDAELARRL